MSEESKSLTVCKKDIKGIGHTTFSNEGMTVFVCGMSLHFIEEILLRNILELYGYKIVTFGEIPCDCENCEDTAGIAFGTNMPWKEYMALKP